MRGLFSGSLPAVVVGVVGIGHQKGIVENWQKSSCDVNELMK
jgi:pheromone shutdown protein TraB